MSFDALAWAAKCQPGSLADKMVLLALAESANRHGSLSFPSIAAICEFGNMDRKTVIASLGRLQEAGFVRDTGKRTGRTGQVKVFHLDLSKSPENGTVKECRKRDSIPKTGPLKSTVFTRKESRKRDTEPVRNQLSTIVDNTRAAKKDIFPKPEWADQQVWTDFLANRKTKRLKNTPTAYKGFLEDIARHTTAAWTPQRLLEHATRKGWGGIYAPVGDIGCGAEPSSFLAHKVKQKAEHTVRSIGP